MSDFDFQDYLSAIAVHYAQNGQFYAPIDVLLPLKARSGECGDDRASQSSIPFSFFSLLFSIASIGNNNVSSIASLTLRLT